jgi:hypothetical protein
MTTGTISIIIGVVILVLVKLLVKDEKSSSHKIGLYESDQEDLFKEEPEFDRTWSILPGNIFHRSNDD